MLLVGHLGWGILESPGRTLLAVCVSIATELLIGRIALGEWPHPAGAWMTGTSVGMLVRSPAYWPFAWCAAISILSKYVIRLRGRHIWNPSNFGVSFMLFVYPMFAAHLSVQWGNSTWSNLMVWTLGSFVILRLRLGHICLAYVATFLALAGPRSWITGHAVLTEIAPLTGPMHQLFVLLMITDPKTSVSTRDGRIAMVMTVAVLESVFRCLPTYFPGSALVLDAAIHAPFYALFIVGPSFLTAEILRAGGRAPVIPIAPRCAPAPAHREPRAVSA